MTFIITHRGIDAERSHSFSESSREAFQYFLDDGFGLEFDIHFTKDKVPVISHDDDLSRVAGNENLLSISEMTTEEFLATTLPHGHTLTFDELIEMMRNTNPERPRLHALHLKQHNQQPEELELLLPYLEKISNLPIILFDVTPECAQKLKAAMPKLILAASVAHPYDIVRYNAAVGNTLITIDEVIKYRHVFDWVWLDEWDRSDENDGEKILYTKANIESLYNAGYKVVIVSPELHATSPKLLGGESHPDGQNVETLKHRWVELHNMNIDAICTDFPHILRDEI